MTQSLLITLREGLEAGLIVVIVLAYLKGVGHKGYWKNAWLGTAAAVAVSAMAGAVVFAVAGEFEGRAEQVFEGLAMLTAVVVLSWMIIWMKRQAVHIRGELQARIDTALVSGSALAIAVIPFVAVLREGIETVVFMLAASRTSTSLESTIGASVGLILAVALGYVLYRGGRRLNLRLFFNATGALLILFAAGLLAHGIHELQEAQLAPVLVEHVWDVNGVLSDDAGLGLWLKGIFGYNGNPALLEVLAYPLYLVVAFWYFLSARPTPVERRVPVAAEQSLAE